MDKAKILSAIIDEQEKVINNLKASIERYKQESNMDEDNTLDPDDYARQNEAKDMQLRYENMLKSAKHNLNF
jgi:rRNA maturation endonuclease Nob1